MDKQVKTGPEGKTFGDACSRISSLLSNQQYHSADYDDDEDDMDDE